MRRFILFLAVLICCENALAMGGGHGTKPVSLNDPHLTELANQPGRVGGYWVNSNDWFYFRGDTQALNDFLRRYAKLTETPLVLVIHPGKAPAERCVGELFEKSYDWKLDSMWPAFTREKEWFEKPNGGQWQRAVIVQTWLGGNIRLDKLTVPANVEVREGSEIKEFVERHNRQRVRREAQCLDRRQNVILRGAAESCRHLCLDVVDDTQVEQIGGAASARCLRLAEDRLPRVRWKLTKTEWGQLIQAQSGKFANWYLDFDDDAEIGQMGGATSSRNLLLTKEKVPGAYWKVTETGQGFLIQAQVGRFEGWYLDLDLLTKEKAEGVFWQFEVTTADTSMDDEPPWGDPLEGVQCRVRPEKSTWTDGETPQLQADLWNLGRCDLAFALNPISWDIECDGVWYHAPDATGRGVLSSLKRGRRLNCISLRLEYAGSWLSKKDNLRLMLRPGKHQMRAAFNLGPDDGAIRDEGELRVVSNLVEIEIGEWEAEVDRESEPLVIDLIRAEGNLSETPSCWIGYEQLSEEALRERAKRLLKASPGREVVVRADRAMPHQPVAELLKLLKAVGANDVSLAVFPLDSVFAIDPGAGRDGTIRGKLIVPSNQRGRPVNYFVTLDNEAWAHHGGERPTLEVAPGERFEFRNVPAGKYKVRARPVTASGQDGGPVAKTAEVEVIVRNGQVVEVELSFDQSKTSAAWGEEVDGLQCRLHVEKTTLEAGQWPRLLVDVKNRGERELTFGDAPDFWELECDGTWYRNGVMFSGDCEILNVSPLETLRNFPLLLAERWKWQAKEGNERLAFGPGKHVLRVALRPAPKQRAKWPRVLSQPVAIKVIPNQHADH